MLRNLVLSKLNPNPAHLPAGSPQGGQFAPKNGSYNYGDRVVHATYGPGTVTRTGSGPNGLHTSVQFDSDTPNSSRPVLTTSIQPHTPAPPPSVTFAPKNAPHNYRERLDDDGSHVISSDLGFASEDTPGSGIYSGADADGNDFSGLSYSDAAGKLGHAVPPSPPINPFSAAGAAIPTSSLPSPNPPAPPLAPVQPAAQVAQSLAAKRRAASAMTAATAAHVAQVVAATPAPAPAAPPITVSVAPTPPTAGAVSTWLSLQQSRHPLTPAEMKDGVVRINTRILRPINPKKTPPQGAADAVIGSWYLHEYGHNIQARKLLMLEHGARVSGKPGLANYFAIEAFKSARGQMVAKSLDNPLYGLVSQLLGR
jgi:hypothetical protein